MSDVKLGMGRTKIKPLKYVESCLGESPIDKCFKLKDEWNSHKTFKKDIIYNMIAVHKEISFLHLCNSIPYLECTYPEIETVKDIKYN